jgi:hypothetical protein
VRPPAILPAGRGTRPPDGPPPPGATRCRPRRLIARTGRAGPPRPSERLLTGTAHGSPSPGIPRFPGAVSAPAGSPGTPALPASRDTIAPRKAPPSSASRDPIAPRTAATSRATREVNRHRAIPRVATSAHAAGSPAVEHLAVVETSRGDTLPDASRAGAPADAARGRSLLRASLVHASLVHASLVHASPGEPAPIARQAAMGVAAGRVPVVLDVPQRRTEPQAAIPAPPADHVARPPPVVPPRPASAHLHRILGF